MRWGRLGLILLLTVLVIFTGCKKLVLEENVTSEDKIEQEEISESVDVEEDLPAISKPASEMEYVALVSAYEGELIELNPEAIDPDGDVVEYSFSDPFNEAGRWQTSFGDAGDYLITIMAHDGDEYTSQDVLVRVMKTNRPPILNCPDKITVKEGEIIKIECEVVDPEGEEVIVTYRGFMSTSMYETTYADAGKYSVVITAWDKEHSGNKVQDTVIIEVTNVNRPPDVKLEFGLKINAIEGDIVRVDPDINDPDDDEIVVSYSKPFNQDGIWRTKIGDAGTHDATITVKDGHNIVRKDFTVFVEEVNTYPVLEEIPDIFVDEGEKIILDIKVSDRETEDLTIKIEGFMDSEEYLTTYEDAFPNGCEAKGCTANYRATVTVSDGELKRSQIVRIHVRDVNRPPVFRVPA